MQDMSEGIQLDPEALIQVLQNKLAQAAIKEAQLEAAVQSLLIENSQLTAQIPKDEEVKEDASAEQ